MIKIIQADYLHDKTIQVHFPDHSWGDYDLLPLLERQSELTKVLLDDAFFKEFYLEMGALCWRNGLELSPGNIHRKLQEKQLLHNEEKVA